MEEGVMMGPLTSEVRVFKTAMGCDQQGCWGELEYEYTISTYKKYYVHKCTKCQRRMELDQRYPIITYKYINES